MRQITVIEDTDGAYVEIANGENKIICYEFESWEDAIESLSSLEEIN